MKPSFLLSPLKLPRTAWLEGGLFLALVVALTLPFWLTDLDIQAAGIFFHPENPQNFWPEEQQGLWTFLYKAIPVLVNVLFLACLAALAFSGSRPGAKRTRRLALFVLLSVALGPGLVVNGIFKDHYGRPRPRQIEQFHGHLAYQPPGLPGVEGKSFPCGHCSVGYVFWVFYFVSRRRKPALAASILLAAIGFGLLVGVGRMAAGGHFLSDVLWSGFFSYAVCALLYQPLLGKWEDTPDEQVAEFFLFDYWQKLPASTRPWALGSVAVLLSVAASLATPYKLQQELTLPMTGLTIDAQVGDVVLHQTKADNIQARLTFKGFGFPTSQVEAHYDTRRQILVLAQSGWFTDLEGQLEVDVPEALAAELAVTAVRGKVFLSAQPPQNWHLRAAKGVVKN